jgi:thioesterase domain-containing protein
MGHEIRSLVLLEQAQKAKTKVKAVDDDKRKGMYEREREREREAEMEKEKIKRDSSKKLAKKANCLRERGFRKNMNKTFHVEQTMT